ncbi:MAG: hypothetical protein R3C53_10190 [Pirellulaceae bacterium]
MIRRKKNQETQATQVQLPPIEFKPRASDPQIQQGLLIACRSMEQYGAALMLLAHAFRSRADQIMLDYSQQGAAVRYRVDGNWERMPPMDRPTGDGVLVIFKRLCSLNPRTAEVYKQALCPPNLLGTTGSWTLRPKAFPPANAS